MRIAMISEVFLPKVDGVVIRTMNLIRHLLDEDDEVLVVCPHADGRTESPVPIFEFPSFPFAAYPEYHIGLPNRQLVTTLEEFQPDVLHYINPFAFGFRCHDILQKAKFRKPTVMSFHTLYGEFVKGYPLLKPMSRLLWWLMKDYHNTADLNLTVSAIMRDQLRNRGFERVELWPPAVNCELFDPAKRSEAMSSGMRERLTDGHPDKPLLLTVSRLAPEKNVAFLAKVIRQHPEARLAIIGDGPARPSLEKTFADTPTKFFGYMQGEELARAYATADGFLYASETETMGNVILEAMASGLAVIAPHAGGIPSLMNNEQDGILYPPRSVEKASGAVKRVLEDPDYRSNLARNARSTVEEWGWNRAVQRVREYYAETIDTFDENARPKQKRRKRGPLMVSALVRSFRTMAIRHRKAVKQQRPQAIPASEPETMSSSTS